MPVYKGDSLVRTGADLYTPTGSKLGVGGAPALATLDVMGAVANTTAVFRNSTASVGIGVIYSFPNITMNLYFNVNWKAIGTGFGAALGINPTTGLITIVGTAVSVAQDAIATPITRLAIDANGLTGIGLVPAGNGFLQTKAGNQTTTKAKVGGIVADYFTDAGNSGTSETDLYTTTFTGDMLTNNGDKFVATYAGIFVNHATATRQLKVYFGGTAVFDSGALTVSAAAEWEVRATFIRVSSSVVRCSVAANLTNASTNVFAKYTEVTGLTLTNTQIIKITGTAGAVGAATNDIVAKLGTVRWDSSA